MNLQRVINALESFAPSRLLSEKWDNVGLLVEPSAGPYHVVQRLLLTNDLTESVLDEGIDRNVNMIVSYHPPIFSAFKRLCGGGQAAADWKQRLIVRCIERSIAVYSPHTAWDAVSGGVNDWLAAAFDNCQVRPITDCNWSDDDPHNIVKLTATMNCPKLDSTLKQSLSDNDYRKLIDDVSGSEALRPHLSVTDVSNALSGNGEHKLSISCRLQDAERVLDKVVNCNPGFQSFLRIEKTNRSVCGMGRICDLRERLSLDELLLIIKAHLNIPYVQLAISKDSKDTKQRNIGRVALCAGSGASVLREVEHCDVYWTGEMSHHDVLDAVSKGISVVLCGHSNTERGFLVDFAPKLQDMLRGEVEVHVSKSDADPLVIR